MAGMQKQELIHIHLALWNIKRMLEQAGYRNFDGYERLDILPAHIYKSKAEHWEAINQLAKEVKSTLEGDLHVNFMPAVDSELENYTNELLKQRGW